MTQADAPQSASAAIHPPARTTPYAWYVAGIICLAHIVALMDRYLMSVVLEPLKQDLALTDTQMGILQGPAFALVFTFASLPLGRLADIASRRAIIAAGLAFWSAATVACGMADTFTELLAARLLVGLGEAALLPAAMSLIVGYFSRDKLSRGVSIFTMGGSLGRVAGFVGGGFLLTRFAARDGLDLGPLGQYAPWQAVFIVAGVFGVLIAGLVFLSLKEPPRPATGARVSTAEGLAFMWRRRAAYVALFVPFSMINGVTQLLAAWTVTFYVREHGMSILQAGSLVGITGLLLGPVGHWCGGWLNDRLRTRGDSGPHTTVLTGIMAVTIVLVTLFAFAPAVPLAATFYAGAYFAMSMAGPTGFAGAQAPTPERFRGVVSSIFLISYMVLGLAIGPLAVGLIGDGLFHSGDMLGASIVVATLALGAVALPLAWFGRGAWRAAVAEHEAEIAPH